MSQRTRESQVSLETRVGLLEAWRRTVADGLPVNPSQEVAWRLWRCEREERIEAEVERRNLERAVESWMTELEAIAFLLRGGKPLDAE